MKKFTKMLLLALVFIGVASSLTACGSTEDKLLGLWNIKGEDYVLFTDIKDSKNKGWKKCLTNNYHKPKANYKEALKQGNSQESVYKIDGDTILIRPIYKEKINNKLGYNLKGIKIKNNEMKPKLKGYFLEHEKYHNAKAVKLADLDKDK